MRALIDAVVGAAMKVVRDADAALAAGSIANARDGIQENLRRDALRHASGLANEPESRVAV